MNAYEVEILIEELQKLVVAKQSELNIKNFTIDKLRAEIERLENLLTPKN